LCTLPLPASRSCEHEILIITQHHPAHLGLPVRPYAHHTPNQQPFNPISMRDLCIRDVQEAHRHHRSQQESKGLSTSPSEGLEETILEVLRARKPGVTCCPSEIARKVGGSEWRSMMPAVRAAAAALVVRGEIEICQKGKVSDCKLESNHGASNEQYPCKCCTFHLVPLEALRDVPIYSGSFWFSKG
jgi:hypothetical protein